MNIIIKKVRLVAAPEPAFVGTRIGIKITEPYDGKYIFGIANATIAKFDGIFIDWGDGTRESPSDFAKLLHEYPGPGVYEVRMSDNFWAILLSTADTETYPGVLIGNEVRSLVSNAPLLTGFSRFGMRNLANLEYVNLNGSSVNAIGSSVFSGCPSLKGDVYFQPVATIYATSFKDSPLITAFHFAAANEEVITSSESYKTDPTFGTGSAICLFDL